MVPDVVTLEANNVYVAFEAAVNVVETSIVVDGNCKVVEALHGNDSKRILQIENAVVAVSHEDFENVSMGKA